MKGNSILSSVIIRCFTVSQYSFIIKCSSVFALFLALLNKTYYGTKYFSFCVVRFLPKPKATDCNVYLFCALYLVGSSSAGPTALPCSAVVFLSWHLFTLSACSFRAAGLAEACEPFCLCVVKAEFWEGEKGAP